MELTPLYKRVIGLDVHHEQVTACAIVDENGENDSVIFQTFGTFHNDCQSLAKWASEFRPELVVMESTGIYWKAVNRALQREGLKTIVANARHLKRVPGRKTDMADSHWLAILGRAGLVSGSFIIGPDFEHLRLISRHRQKIAGMLSSEKNRLHKVLADAGVRLSLVVSDLHGVSARQMIKCLIEGGSADEAMSKIRTRLNTPLEVIRQALDGDLTTSHRFVLCEIMGHIEILEATIARFEDELLSGLTNYEWAMRILETIPGVDRVGAAMLLVEMGVDMDAFVDASKFASWAGVCPGNNESAGKRKSGKLRKGNPYLRHLLCEMANAARRSHSALKAKYQSLVVRRGHGRSIMALAHKLIRVIFALLSKKEPYQDKTINYEELMVKRQAPRWIRALKKYGFLPASI
jgi:transposase